jgi:hypothetical protein
MEKYSRGMKGRTRWIFDIERGTDQWLRHISGNEAAWKIIIQRRVRENRHGFIRGCVAPLEVHRGEKESD